MPPPPPPPCVLLGDSVNGNRIKLGKFESLPIFNVLEKNTIVSVINFAESDLEFREREFQTEKREIFQIIIFF